MWCKWPDMRGVSAGLWLVSCHQDAALIGWSCLSADVRGDHVGDVSSVTARWQLRAPLSSLLLWVLLLVWWCDIQVDTCQYITFPRPFIVIQQPTQTHFKTLDCRNPCNISQFIANYCFYFGYWVPSSPRQPPSGDLGRWKSPLVSGHRRGSGQGYVRRFLQQLGFRPL